MASLAFARTAAPIIVDGKGHLLGRLASTLAKQILNGQKVAPLPRLSVPALAAYHNDQRLTLSFISLLGAGLVCAFGNGLVWDLCGILALGAGV